ncbi:hypothetical protein ACOMHN_059653 [Nucella lapillus]
MLESLTSSVDVLTSQSLLLEQVRTWVGKASTSLTLLIASAILGSILQWRTRHRHQSSGGGAGDGTTGPLPPSPGVALPLVGHLHLMKGEKDPRVVFQSLREKLGDIFSFYAGSRLVVVLNGYDVIHEALVRNAAVFSHRAHTFMSEKMGNGRGIVNTSGRHWREQRQFVDRALRALGTSQASQMGQTIQREVDAMLASLEESRQQGRPVDPRFLVQASFSNVIISIIYGRRFDFDDPEFVSLLTALNNCFENFGNTEPLNFFPAVRFLPGDPYRYWFCIENVNALENSLVYPEMTAHERKLDSAESKDVISTYLREMMQKRSKGTPTFMDKENLVKVAGDLLAGGTEPPSTTTLWILLYLVHFPEVQEKCYQELLSHLGTGRPPTLEDRSSLPYLEATIMEVQRHADVGPLAMAHGLARDTKFRGYRLPQDAIVLINIHSVHHEAKDWGDPEVFRPERFIGEDGRVKKNDHLIPYSLGPRICPGELMARLELFLYISSILYQYRLAPHGDAPPPLAGRMALLHTPRPYHFTVEKRH